MEDILHKLDISLRENTSELLNDKDTEHFEFTEVLNNMVTEFQKQSREGLKDLKNATEIKSQYLKDFTIALFGRTKAGKSSIRESLTRNGDGSTIGLGKLHNTKEVGDYKWKGLRILDTPGIEGYGGEVEASKAHDIIDQSDVIIFLTTDETQQPGEFDEMERLIEINKPFFIVLNIKDKLTEPAYLGRFLKGKGNLFNNEIIEENKQRIFSETKRIGIYNIKIIWISALASCISQFSDRGFAKQNKKEFINSIKHPQIRDITRWVLDKLNIQDVHRMWQLSQMDKVYEYIAYEVNSHGMQRRVLTFYDSTINFIDTIAKMLSVHQHSLRAYAKYMVEKREKLRKFFERFIEESNLKIERTCEELFNPIKEWIPNFIDEYLGEDNAQSVLKRRFNEEKKKIEEGMNGLMEEIIKELQTELSEFTKEYRYDIRTIKLAFSEIGDLRKGQTSKFLKWMGIASGTVSTVACGIAYFAAEEAAVNFWNPIGWIAAGVSIVAGFLAWLFGSDEEEEWLRAKKAAKERLWNSIDKMERKTRGAYKSWFYKNITTKGKEAMLDKISLYINGLFEIGDILKRNVQQLLEIEKQINKELFMWLFQLEDVRCSEKDILSIAREQGIATKIMLNNKWHIDGRTGDDLHKLCGESIFLFNDSADIREKVARSLYPAKPLRDQIEITHINGKTTAKITIPNKEEKGLYIGRNGVNIRLAQQVCGIKIELI